MWEQYYKTTQGQVKAFHVTPKDNVESILRDGLIARACKATANGDHRQNAVYLFAARQDAYDCQLHDFLFDDGNVVVIEVTIPEDAYHLLREDGLFNMSAICSDNSYPTAMQYLDNIPAEWLKVQK